MDWPITPTFFRKVAVFQRLIDAENGFKQKNIWEAEKVVLRWAISDGHQLVGSSINETHVKDLLKEKINQGIHSGDTSITKLFDFAISFPNNLLEALVMHGFAETPINIKSGKYEAKITPDGFMAGQILKETNGLKNAVKYKLAVNSWWGILLLGAIILIRQAFPWLFPMILAWFQNLVSK